MKTYDIMYIYIYTNACIFVCIYVYINDAYILTVNPKNFTLSTSS